MNARLVTVRQKQIVLGLSLVLLVVAFIGSIVLGVAQISWKTIISSYSNYDGSQEQIIIRTTRTPRALIAGAVGSALAVAGALMQVLTRNPLASPSVFGINAGAAFFIVVGSAFFGVTGMTTFAQLSFLGAATTAAIVYILGSVGTDGLTPLKITLAGAAMTSFFSSLTLGLLLTGGQTFDQVLYWLVGSVSGRTISIYAAAAPYMAVALIGAYFLSRHLNVLILGDDVASGLGQKTIYIKLVAAIIIVVLAGGAVSMAGPIAFVGIIIPHIVKYFVGSDYRWVIPYCAVFGANLLLIADIGSRFIAFPKEVPVGILTAILGVPFLVYIARKGGGTA